VPIALKTGSPAGEENVVMKFASGSRAAVSGSTCRLVTSETNSARKDNAGDRDCSSLLYLDTDDQPLAS
jgi:hypothetical protein